MSDDFWVSVGGFKFTESHIVFALKHWEELHLWRWPPKPKPKSKSASGDDIEFSEYDIEPQSVKTRRYKPPFSEKITDIYASIEMYCDELGRDGMILLTRFSENYRDDHSCDGLAEKLGMATEQVREIIKNSLWYISVRARGFK